MIDFIKYHGTGNDFIMIDNRALNISLSTAQVAHLCHRRFGIGADGLILLQNHAEADFEMVYFNSDGHPSSMCGNGGRCIAAFATDLHVPAARHGLLTFMAVDGLHTARVLHTLPQGYMIDLEMQDVNGVQKHQHHAILNTGSPHYVATVPDTDRIHIIPDAHAIRYSATYKEKGINVNFIQSTDLDIKVRTYERGVEDETWSCGTGVVASAIAAELFYGTAPAHIQTKGGLLQVTFKKEAEGIYTDIHLIGPAVQVFKGSFLI